MTTTTQAPAKPEPRCIDCMQVIEARPAAEGIRAWWDRDNGGWVHDRCMKARMRRRGLKND